MSTRGGPEEAAPTETAQLYLLVIDADSSTAFPLPAGGEVVIGRGADADLRLRDTAVSRRHARITIVNGEASICDLGSHNSTWVNGERVTGTTVLASGDAIALCGVTLVFHANARRTSPAVVELAHLRSRAEGEIERSIHYRRPLLFLAISLRGNVDRPRVSDALARSVRSMDVVAWSAPNEVIALLPEHDDARGAARICKAVQAVSPGASLGMASCPNDGCDVATLINAARAAAQIAMPGTLASAASAHRTLKIGPKTIVVADPAMERLFALIGRLAAADLPVLVCGETGAGKELAASAVHHWSSRGQGPLVAVNCAALPETLVESELFGHEKGAFTGASTSKPGLVEQASGGSMFFDEIGELPLAVQAKLLRVLETKRVTRVGSAVEREVDLRIIAATNRDLAEEVAAGRFRQDLLFRLNSATLWLPPLRDRKRDIPLLATAFLTDACQRTGRSAMTIAPEAIQHLATYPWPGNVRELKNVMEYVAAAYEDDVVMPWHLVDRIGESRLLDTHDAPVVASDRDAPRFRPIDDEIRELEKGRMIEALLVARGNQTRAAELIQMPLRTFQGKVKTYGLRRVGEKRS